MFSLWQIWLAKGTSALCRYVRIFALGFRIVKGRSSLIVDMEGTTRGRGMGERAEVIGGSLEGRRLAGSRRS
jgi:hypothetical protein